MEKELSVSAGNLRREFLALLPSNLFVTYNKGRLIYYRINATSTIYQALKVLMKKNISPKKNIVGDGFLWVNTPSPSHISDDRYCQTRDVFQVRLESFSTHLEQNIGIDAYLITAIAGEIGNNSFDHNLGSWRDIAGIYFAYDYQEKRIVLADRGQGIFKTISRVMPDVKNDKEALDAAFTKTVSGRSPEKRGNGLKFVSQNIKDKKWSLQFDSGRSSLTIDTQREMKIINGKRNVQGTFALIQY